MIQPMESGLLRQRNYQIISERSMLRTTSLTISHIDVDCQVVARPGRLTFIFSSCLKRSHIIPERQWSTIPFTSVGPIEYAASPWRLNMRSSTARRHISCKPLLHSLQGSLPTPNLLYWRRLGSRSDQRDLIHVLMPTVRKYTSNSAV
jgi:hypothetical protein